MSVDGNAGAAAAAASSRSRLLALLALVAILALAAHLRLRAAAELVVSPPLQGDSVAYVSMAYNIRHYGTVSVDPTWTRPQPRPPTPDAARPPGYPWLLAAAMPDLPDVAFLRRVLAWQVLLGVLAVGLGYALARTVLPRAGALAVAAALALSPHLVALGASVLTETLFTALLAAFALALAVAARRESVAGYLVAGVLLAATALVRPTLQYAPLLLVPAVAWLSTKAPARQAGALLLGFVLVFAPWLVRNQLETGALSDPALNARALLHGSYADFRFNGDPASEGYPYRFDPRADEVRTTRQALARIGENFAADPAGTLRWYALSKVVRLHDWAFVEGVDIYINRVSATPYAHRGEFRASYFLMRLLHAPLMLAGAAGAVLALAWGVRRRRTPDERALALLALVLATALGMHVLGMPLSRYAVPLRPLTFLFAAVAVAAAWRRFARR